MAGINGDASQEFPAPWGRRNANIAINNVKEEARSLIEEAGMELTDNELDKVAGGVYYLKIRRPSDSGSGSGSGSGGNSGGSSGSGNSGDSGGDG